MINAVREISSEPLLMHELLDVRTASALAKLVPCVMRPVFGERGDLLFRLTPCPVHFVAALTAAAEDAAKLKGGGLSQVQISKYFAQDYLDGLKQKAFAHWEIIRAYQDTAGKKP